MSNEEIKKLISMVKSMPEGYKILKNLLLEFLAIREENEKLVQANSLLLEDINQYELNLAEEKSLTIN